MGKFLFQKNANTPLSLLFDHTSALEQMHYQLLKRVMRRHGLGVFLDDPLHGTHVRDILRSSVIFTDMSVHNDFMAQFKKLIEIGGGSISQRQTIVCQALLKNADISNPVCTVLFWSFTSNLFLFTESTVLRFDTLGKGFDARMEGPSQPRGRVRPQTFGYVFYRPHQRSRLANLLHQSLLEAHAPVDGQGRAGDVLLPEPPQVEFEDLGKAEG